MKGAKISSDNFSLKEPLIHRVSSFLHSFPRCPLRTRPWARYSGIETNQTASLLARESHVQIITNPTATVKHNAFWTEQRGSFSIVGSGWMLSHEALFKALGPGLEGRQGGGWGGGRKHDNQKEKHLKRAKTDPNRFSEKLLVVWLGSSVSDATRSADKAQIQRYVGLGSH